MTEPATPAAPDPRRCNRCGISFGCGARMESCWCQDLPSLPAALINESTGCYCPTCLAELTRAAAAPDVV